MALNIHFAVCVSKRIVSSQAANLLDLVLTLHITGHLHHEQTKRVPGPQCSHAVAAASLLHLACVLLKLTTASPPAGIVQFPVRIASEPGATADTDTTSPTGPWTVTMSPGAPDA